MSEHTVEKDAGLESRYYVVRLNDQEGKHAGCRYFVLDPQHDWLARAALTHYANGARTEGYTALADDLDAWLRECVTPPGVTS